MRDLLGRHLVHHLKVDTQVCHTIGDLPTESTGRHALVNLAVMTERVRVAINTSAQVAGVHIWGREVEC